MVKPIRLKDPVADDDPEATIQTFESERMKLERAAYDKAGAIYPDDDFENKQRREFLYYKSLFPDTYWCWIDQVWRVLDERDGKEYIMYHVYEYVDQKISSPDGKTVNRTHKIDSYEGFYHDPQTQVKEFNPNGTFKKVVVDRVAKVYTILWSKETLDALLDAPENRGTCNQFALGFAPQDASLTVPDTHSTQKIRNREDFSLYDFDKTMELGRSKLSTSVPSMEVVQQTLKLRKQMEEKNAQSTAKTSTPASTNK